MKTLLPKLFIVHFSFFIFLAAGGEEVRPQKHYRSIASRFAGMLPRYHVLQQQLGDEISRRAWTNLVTFYDFDHSVFLKGDLDRLARHETTIDDELKAGDVSFGFEVHNLYVERLRERMFFATNLLLTAEWDFSSNEVYRIRRKDAPWPATKAEAEEHWRKRMKNEVLVQVLSAELDGSTNRVAAAENLIKKYRQYATVLTEPDEEQVLQHYLSAVARAYDPHSDYMSPASKEDFDMDMNLELSGVGAVLSMEDGALKIVEVMTGGPVDRDGRIKEGDKIVGVQQADGEMEDVMWQPMKKSIRKIRGKKGTRVTLEIIPRSDPSGATKKRIELVRDVIKLEDSAATGRVERVEGAGVTNRIGYVYLPGFYGTMDKKPSDEGFRSCAQDVAKYIADFNSQDVGGMILDLRGDGGGSLREAVYLSALFVPNGPVVLIRDTRAAQPLNIPPGNPVAFRKPLIVLTDRASASASEIVAGHLRDTGRAIVLGDRTTHGKGTVQSVMGMGPDKFGSMKITTARFYRVDGRSTQLKGIEADLHLPSLLDSLDIGEDKLTYALPFTRIGSARYQKCWNLDRFIPELATNSAARLAADARYLKHLENVKGMKAISEREQVSLERETRKAQMKADREYRELDEVDDEFKEEDDIEVRGQRSEVREGEVGGQRSEVREGETKTEEPKAPAKRRKRNELPKDDVVLDEAFKVMNDLIRLNGGEEMPFKAVDWYNAILGD